MNQYELETKIEGLKKAIAEHNDFAGNYASELEKVEKQLKDYNKIALPPMVFDEIYEAIELATSRFDFSDTDNFDIEYGIEYDGKVHCESHELTDTYELTEKIVKKVHALFVEKLDTTEPDHHAPIKTNTPSKDDIKSLNERVQKQKEKTEEKTFKKRTWF